MQSKVLSVTNVFWHDRICSISAFVFVFSDVYVFGVGDKVKKDELNSLASHKRNEKHVFVVEDFVILGKVFNSIISKYEIILKSNAQTFYVFTEFCFNSINEMSEYKWQLNKTDILKWTQK